MPLSLAEAWIYPVKSTMGRPAEAVCVEPLGLAGDRRWMVADGDGECITARTDRNLLCITATVDDEALVLRAPGHVDLVVPCPQPDPAPDFQPKREDLQVVPVTVHGRPLHGIPAGWEANEWIGRILDRDDARLVQVARARPLNPEFSQDGDATAFADGYPVTLASTASLRQLNDWIVDAALERGEEPEPLAMHRFRPNLVIDGDLEPFAEDVWREVQIGEVTFDVAKAIDRCVLTTIDPMTLESGPEPIRTLARHRKWEGKTWFGLQLIPRRVGEMRIGDPVSVTARGD